MSTVSVVVPYYDSPEQLALMVAALERQTWPLDRLELVIADDGSQVPPQVSSHLDHRVVWQEDLGFRAAAARNLGARAARGAVICFLDCDTIPEPEYVERAVAPVLADPSALVVGRRKHRYLTGPRAGEDLPEPAWLTDGYRRTRDLRDADDSSYRYVISAVLTMSRALFELTPFDESFTGYGGEDWELAWRAWLAGARFLRVPEAVAVHDGPDWAGRSAQLTQKNAESMRLARFVTHPAARPRGVRFERTEVVADLTALAAGPAAAVAAAALLEYGDLTAVMSEVPEVLAEDPRAVTRINADIEGNSRVYVTVLEPVRLDPGLLTRLITGLGDADAIQVLVDGRPVARVESCRGRARQRYWAVAPRLANQELALELIDPEVRLEAHWAGWD